LSYRRRWLAVLKEELDSWRGSRKSSAWDPTVACCLGEMGGDISVSAATLARSVDQGWRWKGFAVVGVGGAESSRCRGFSVEGEVEVKEWTIAAAAETEAVLARVCSCDECWSITIEARVIREEEICG
jgi:hypothetical protein